MFIDAILFLVLAERSMPSIYKWCFMFSISAFKIIGFTLFHYDQEFPSMSLFPLLFICECRKLWICTVHPYPTRVLGGFITTPLLRINACVTKISGAMDLRTAFTSDKHLGAKVSVFCLSLQSILDTRNQRRQLLKWLYSHFVSVIWLAISDIQ